ncbi:phytoene desaturase family protein [Metabacillus fastidiosus]|uniref:phytoene desaturase family protein n=1 Tax=Metabacillus fastidiosus TaxID=1458 RepID=UPI002E1AEE0F|nr:phytoene desaturase family protein [Metabacillus fastidiosus]MED4533163.1 phytoene desaturase family protein [Metabacillus fastidiosus]
MKKIIIVGGGLGGLSAAVTLANAGFQVELFEKNRHFGGKLMHVQLGDYSFDFGPNTITMPYIFQEVIEQTGEKAEDYFNMIKLNTHTRNIFQDGTQFDFSSNQQDVITQLEKLDPAGARHYPSFIGEITRLYHLSKKHFFRRSFCSWRDYTSPALAAAMTKVKPLQTLDNFFRSYFSNPNIIQSYNRYATYIGSSPYKAPATFAMIAYLEMVEGVYYTEGGNVKIAEAFVSLARKFGVGLHNETEVEQIIITNKKASGVKLKSGDIITGDYIIMNADLLKAYPELVYEQFRPSFKNSKVAKLEPSISAFVILTGMKHNFQQLKHHNVYFSNDYQQEFTDLFKNKTYSKKPTIYICNSAHTDPARSPKGDNLFILANAPSLPHNGKLQVEPDAYKELIYDTLLSYGLNLNPHIKEEKVITPSYIADTFGAYRGALYGLSSNRKLDAFLRPKNVSRDINNLFFVGGSTHPGGGSPMVTLSGLNVGKRIINLEMNKNSL